MASIGIRPRHR